MTCKTFRWSFSVHDEHYHPVLMCWPSDDRKRERIACEACQEFERDAGDDEGKNGS